MIVFHKIPITNVKRINTLFSAKERTRSKNKPFKLIKKITKENKEFLRALGFKT